VVGVRLDRETPWFWIIASEAVVTWVIFRLLLFVDLTVPLNELAFPM